MKFLLFLISFTLLSATSIDSLSITVIHQPVDSKLRAFEYELFKKVIKFYNLKNPKKILLNHVQVNDFNKIRPYMLSDKVDPDNVIAMGYFTISNYPQYSYSYPYLPVRDSFISLKTFTPKSAIKCGYNDNPYNLEILKSYKGIKQFLLVPLKSDKLLNPSLRSGKVDVIFYDSYTAFFEKDFKIYKYLSETTRYIGYIYPKSSKLRKVLEPTMKYFMKSSSYYAMLREYFGPNISDYIEKTMKGLK